ncbi:MAG: hypothetical protein JXN61_18755, partial [Sedimentisphaerales bacterium]|nr:hypothetical protein [Sedimentisphaerales bacterium]
MGSSKHILSGFCGMKLVLAALLAVGCTQPGSQGVNQAFDAAANRDAETPAIETAKIPDWE